MMNRPALILRAYSLAMVVLLTRFYQYTISPCLGIRCRFTPSCSEYMLQAMSVHGFWKGIWLGTKRLLKCHPWGQHGYDPIPSAEKLRATKD